MKQRRDRQVNVRLTEEEFEALSALADETGQRVSSILRACVQIAFAVPSAEEANIRRFDELVGQLARVGNNLNQLARRANRGHLVLTEGQAEVLRSTSAQASSLYDALIEYKRLAQSRSLSTRIDEVVP